MSPKHITEYKSYVGVLIVLLILTILSVAITYIDLDEYTVAGALILASAKSLLVLMYFMHLKFEKKFFVFMVASVFILFTAVTIITFLDYLYR
jgi:cytochrome c oxidase subunit 4